MFTIPPRRATLVALLSLLIFGSARADERPERRNESGLGSCNHKISNTAEWREIIVTNIIESVASESIVTATTLGKVNDGQAQEPRPSPSQGDIAAELQLRRRKTPTSAEAAQITTPPLFRRQSQAQIDQLNARIQSLQESAQAALQSLSSASRSVSQESQRLSQSSQQLSQDSSRLSAASLSLTFALSLAQQSEASLTGALSAAISSGNSALASCTSSAASALAVASGDAQTKVGAALAQATNARAEADLQVTQAQSSAVSITQAAAIIVGASAGSSLLTLIIILLVLRYRRRKRREREAQAERGSFNNGPRPGTSSSYNSMAAAPRDVKDQALMTGSTAVATAPERFQSVRIVDVSRNGSKNSVARGGGGGGGTAPRSKPESFLGERLSRLGITRRPTGEALTTDYVQPADSVRKPVMTLADPPAAKERRNETEQQDLGASSKTTPTFSVFPKIDPDPKGTMLKTVREESSRPPSTGATLQAWLETAEISPFGPLEPPPAKQQSSSSATTLVDNNNRDQTSKGAPGPSRLTEVKWPLQDGSPDGGGASDRFSQATSTAAAAPAVEHGNIPVALLRDNPANQGTPQVGPGRMKGPGLPGSVRKTTSGPGIRDVSAKGREQRLGG
ncbi:hypothetical protein N0V82_009781 [Gnomoniopsis sp. IMI 355080]|nr:hypothetical protein N0V82_009781 [Gnomoniopsis sp. IMI 355080]